MPLITWTKEQFGTSVKTHDEEHQQLFKLLNELHERVEDGDRSTVGMALDKLIAFVGVHFSSEEKNMKKAGYARLEQHKMKHGFLVHTCLDLQKKFHDGNAEVTEQTTHFLRDWLIDHIPHNDLSYAPSLKSAGIY